MSRRHLPPFVKRALKDFEDLKPTHAEIIDRLSSADEDAARIGVPKQHVLDFAAFRALRLLYPELHR